MACPYAILGLLPTADPEVVEAALRILLRKHHPDKGGDAAAFRKFYAAGAAIRAGSPMPEDLGGSESLRARLSAIWGPVQKKQ